MTAATDQHRDSALLEAALWYASKGLHVLPLHTPTDGVPCDCGRASCTDHGKHPWTTHGLLEATTDPSIIREWWQRYPRANIGIRTGPESGIVVVDVDPRHNGYATLQQLFEQHGAFPATRESKTGGGGSHFFFTHPGGSIQSGNGALGPGVDLKADGGYVVAPPSLHESGQHYEWVQPTDDATSALLPGWVTEVREISNGTGGDVGHVDLTEILGGVPEGQRDSWLFRAASKLRWAGVPMEWAERLIVHAAHQCIPPFPDRDALAKVASAYGRYQPGMADIDEAGDAVQVIGPDSIRVVTVSLMGPIEFIFDRMEKSGRDLDAEMSIRLLLPGTPPESYNQRINMLSASARESCRRELDALYGKQGEWTKVLVRAFSKAKDAFLGMDRATHAPSIAAPLTLEYTIESFMPAQGTTIVFGAGSAGKTYLCYGAAIAVSNGVPWLGRQTERRRVLVIDYETGQDVFAYRLRRVLLGLDDEALNMDGIWHWEGGGIPLLDQTDAIQRAIDRHGIGMLVVDHGALACGAEPEKSESALRLKRGLERLHLPTLLICHITGDGEKDPTQVLRPFGSVFWSNLARQTWFVNRAQEQLSSRMELGLYSRKVNDGIRQPDWGANVFFEEDGGPVKVTIADIRKSPTLLAARGREYVIYEFLTEPTTLDDIARALNMTQSVVRHALGNHPRMFKNTLSGVGGRGNKAVWARND